MHSVHEESNENEVEVDEVDEVDQEHNLETSEEPAVSDRRANDWRDPKFYVTLGGFVLTCGVVFFSTVRSITATQLAADQVTGMRAQLTLIDDKLNKMTLSDNSQDKELEFLKRQFEEYKQQQYTANELRDTKIADIREKLPLLLRQANR